MINKMEEIKDNYRVEMYLIVYGRGARGNSCIIRDVYTHKDVRCVHDHVERFFYGLNRGRVQKTATKWYNWSMDDDYDYDDYDIDDYDEDLDDFGLEDDLDNEDDDLSDDEVELAGSLDGEFDAEYDAPMYGGYGSSVDLDDLTDEQKDLYDSAYHAGHDSV